MDDVRFLDSLRNAEIDRWVEQVVEARQAGHFCKWMTDVHPDHLSCQMEGDFLHGSFNLNQKWFSVMARPGSSVCPSL